MKKFLTAPLSILATLCLGACCTACGNSKPDEELPAKEEISLTAETDFKSLVSDKVDESGWKKAFTLKDYDVNFTNKLTTPGAEYENYLLKYNINELAYSAYIFDCSIKYDGESYSYYYYTYPFTDEDGYHDEEGFIWKPESGDGVKELSELYKSYFVMYYPDFSDDFGSFTYDETKNSYTCESLMSTHIFEFADERAKDTLYTDIEVKIVNGRLAYFSCYGDNINEGERIVSEFYDFGTTIITYKDVEVVADPQ